jgi:glycosyltransferase involved in cell wall biosynthesis
LSLKAIHVVPGIGNESSGPSYSVVSLCRSLQDAGVATTLAVLQESGHAALPDFVKSFPVSGYPIRLGGSSKMRRWLRDTLQSSQVDVVHNHSLWMMPNVYSCNAAKRANVPLLVSPRGTLSARAMSNGSRIKKVFWPLVQRPALNHVACFHATAHSEYEDIRHMGFSQPVAIIPNGIHIPELIHAERTHVRTLLYLGRIHPIKGLDSLLPAWAAVQKKFPEWQLRIVGPDSSGHLAQMKALATRLKLERIEFTGPLIGSEKQKAYTNADLYVLPTYSENFGMTVAESLAAGTPAIVTKGAPWQPLDEKQAGRWIDTGTDALIACLEEMLDKSQTDLDLMGLNGRNWMLSDYSWEDIARRIMATYDWIIGKSSTPEFVK